MSTAAILVIGNEILSAKVRDENGPWLARELRALGVELRRIETVPDEIEVIADALRRCKASATWVFTSGGVGPTHDDVTIHAIAHALGRRVVRDPGLERGIRAHYGERTNPENLRMADLPEGAVLLAPTSTSFPIPVVEDVYILPGVPEFFRAKFTALRETFRQAPILLRSVYVSVGEGAIAHALDETAAAFPKLALGSYPKFDDSPYRVKLTLESKDAALVAEAERFLLARLPRDCVIRTE